MLPHILTDEHILSGIVWNFGEVVTCVYSTDYNKIKT